MADANKFGILRKILQTIGLSQSATDDAVDFIVDLLDGEDKTSAKQHALKYPYHLRDNFLSPAELEFYKLLRRIVRTRAFLGTKVNLNDIFWVKSGDQSRFRTYTNKIDRKHVDFLICDWETMQPIVAIELDDKSHERKDRQERDAFVDAVFQAANLPILHIKVRRKYDPLEIALQLAPYLNLKIKPQPTNEVTQSTQDDIDVSPNAFETLACSRCGADMVMRTAKKGDNAGNQFWGCSNYPRCREIVDIEAQ